MALRWLLLLLLLVAAAPSRAMVIRDADSAEMIVDAATDAGPFSTDAAPQASSEPPEPSGIELLKKIGWGCDLVTPFHNVSLDTIMGRWYLLEVISPSTDKQQDACAGVDFWRWDDEENNLMPEVAPPPVGAEHLVMRGFNRHANEHHDSSYRVDTAAVVAGSRGALWDQPNEQWVPAQWGGRRPRAPSSTVRCVTAAERSLTACTLSVGASVAVLDYTPDARFLTVTTCVRANGVEWTSVLGRDPDSSALDREALHKRLRAAGLRYADNAKLQNNTECVYP